MIFKAPRDEGLSTRSFAFLMKDSLKRFRVEKISDRGLPATPENLKGRAVGFMLAEGWFQENKPVDGAEMDPQGKRASG
jgi:formate dehydrogenase assembly factor FdhD